MWIQAIWIPEKYNPHQCYATKIITSNLITIFLEKIPSPLSLSLSASFFLNASVEQSELHRNYWSTWPFIKDWFSESKRPVLNSLRIGFSLLIVRATQSLSGYVSHESGFSKRVLQPGHVCRESFSRTRHLIDINETTRCAWVALARSRLRARARTLSITRRGVITLPGVLLLAQAGAHVCAISRAREITMADSPYSCTMMYIRGYSVERHR